MTYCSLMLRITMDQLLLRILVVGFHHKKGSTVEFIHPHPKQRGLDNLADSLPTLWKFLPYTALPDGCHNFEEGHVFFSLPDPANTTGSLYGVSFYRQIEAKDLPSPSLDVTRSTVQKAVCILCSWPVFTFLEEKLRLVTHAYFNSREFSDTSILVQAYMELTRTLTREKALTICYVGLNLRDLTLVCHHRLLQVVKGLLLHNQVLVHGTHPGIVSSAVVSVASLFPGTLEMLICPTSSSIDHDHAHKRKPLLPVFIKSSSLQPYLSLQQMNQLVDRERRLLLIGAVNPLYEKQSCVNILLHLATGRLVITGDRLHSLLSLSSADLRFCDFLSEGVEAGQGVESSTATDNTPLLWIGSSEWVRAQYKSYLLSLLATAVSGDAVSRDDFNKEFMAAFVQSDLYRHWIGMACNVAAIGEMPSRHLCEGELSLGDLKRQLLARASTYKQLERVTQSKQAEQVSRVVHETGRIVSETSQRVQSTVSSWWSSTQSSVMAWWDSTSGVASSGEEEDEREKDSNLGGEQEPIQQPPLPSSHS